MFDTVILLAGAVEHALLSSVLHAHNGQLQVYPVFTAADLVSIEREWLQRARLVAFATRIAVPPDVLDGLGFGAYRFHPGPPHYPDAGAAQFALQDGAAEFGATAHRITSRDAAGPIIDVEGFAIPLGARQATLEDLTRGPLLKMFWRLAAPLATQSAPLVQRAIRWGAKRDIAADTVTTIECASARKSTLASPRGGRLANCRGTALRTVVNNAKAAEA